jgi:hypothetical protein
MKRRSLLIVAAIAILVGLGAGAAYGYFTSSGNGTAVATTGTLKPVTLTAITGGDTPDSTLLPGRTADVILKIDNTNPIPVTITSITANGPITTTGPGTCAAASVTFTPPASPSISIPANTTQLVHLAGAAAMDPDADNSCQGASFDIPITIGVQS